MIDFQLDARPFFVILHSLLRHDELDYDADQTAKVVEWWRTNSATIRKVTSSAEFGCMMTFYGHWDKHKTAPTRKDMTELLYAREQSKPLIEVMEEYDKYAEDLTVESHLSLDIYLDQRVLDYEKFRLARVFDRAMEITINSWTTEDPNPNKRIKYTGPREALKFMHSELQKGVLLDDVAAQGGVLSETASNIYDRYLQTKQESMNNDLFIPTGISLVDGHLGGLRRKELNGILGFVGQRKSAVLRNMSYNAALNRFRVLHIPLESDYNEEENAYIALHAATYFAGSNITKAAIERGELSKADETALREIVTDYRRRVAGNIVVWEAETRDWAEVRQIIGRENDKEPLDLVVIDYLTMLSTPGARDDMADKMTIIQDAKRLAMTANQGRGLCIVTPVQGNRKGRDDAAENDGAWSTSGINKYSELDKSLDNLFYVFFDDAMNAQGQMKMGSCKTRRAANIPSTFVAIDAETGRLRSRSPVTHVEVSGDYSMGLEEAYL